MSFTVRVSCYDLEKTLKSGQLCRYRDLGAGTYLVQSQDKYCLIKQGEDTIVVKTGDTYTSGVSEDDSYWRNYFAFGADYSKLQTLAEGNSFLEEVLEYNRGLHLLHQDPWECLVAFIISQRNNISRIMVCIDKLCQAAGRPLVEDLFAFPTPEELLSLSIDKVGLGYRKSYVLNAAYQVLHGGIYLDRITAKHTTYKNAIQELCTLEGVGLKVANCVALFSLGFTNAFPIDVHIQRVLELPQMKSFCVTDYGDLAGVMQQYLFNYALSHNI